MTAPSDRQLPRRRRRLLVWQWIAIGGGIGISLGALTGLTGVIQMEYRMAPPWAHAIMLSWNFFWLGAVLGLVVGVVLRIVRADR